MSVKKGDSHKSVERQALKIKCLAWIGSNFLSDLNYSGRSLEFLYELEILLMVQNLRVGKDLVCSELLRGRMNLCTIKRGYYRFLNFASHFICFQIVQIYIG